MKEQMNKPMQVMAKRMDGFSSNIINDLKEQIAGFDEKSQIRDMQVQETFAQFQKNISNFEGRIESFANQLSVDMAADIKALSNQIGAAEPRGGNSAGPSAGASTSLDRQQNQQALLTQAIKPELETLKAEVNKKLEIVMNEMRKNAMISDLETLEGKLKKEAKERTYLCKFVEDLTRKIDEIPTNNTYPAATTFNNTRASTSRGLSPDTNSMKMLKQVETDIEDLKEVMNALVDKIEDIQNQDNKSNDGRNVTRDDFERFEKSILQRIEESKDQQHSNEQGDVQQDTEEQSHQRQPRQTLRSDAYLNQNLRSPQFDSQMLAEIPSMRSDQEGYSSRLQNAPEDEEQYNERDDEYAHGDDEDLRQTLLSKYTQNQRDALAYASDQGQVNNNLGESFGFNQHPSRFSSTPATFHPANEEERQQWLRNEQDYQRNGQRASSSGVKRGRKMHQDDGLAASPELGKAMQNGSTLKKKKKSSKGGKSSRSQSKSPSSSMSKIPVNKSSQSIDPKKSRSNSEAEQTSSQARSPKPRQSSKEAAGMKPTPSQTDIRPNGQQKRSPSPLGNKYAEKKKQNGDKIKELFKKKKESSASFISSSSATSIPSRIPEKDKKVVPEKKKKI